MNSTLEVLRRCTRSSYPFCNLKRNSSSNEVKKIKIPERIHRGPTDILKALANTVGSDPTGAHYKYHDDPFLIPGSHMAKRSFALSKESGRKAAQWIRQEHADLFQHKVAVPFIPDFAPRMVFDEKSDSSEETLKTLIRSTAVADAIFVYKLLKSKNKEVSQDTEQSLLELVCFHNSKDDFPEGFLEEKWFRGNKQGGLPRKTWQDGAFADELFKSFKVRDAKAYCALIQGMAKYRQVDRALELYEEMLEKGLPVSTEVFNSLIRVANFVKEGFELRLNYIMDLLKKMEEQKCAPNLRTLNATLEALASMPTVKDCQNIALGVLAEFRKLGIEPSLTSFTHILTIMYKRENANPPILSEIVSFLENKELDIQDPSDVNFFVAAMNICAFKLEDIELAYRLNNILHFANNYNLVGDSFKESIFYRNLFTLACNVETIDEIMELYSTFIPRIYTPEISVMENIIRAVDMNGRADYLPQLWTDILLFDFSSKEQIVTALLDTMYKNGTTEAPLRDQLADIAWGVWNELEDQADKKRFKIMWTGPMIGSVLQMVLNAERLEEAYLVFDKLRKNELDIIGVPELHTLQTFLDAMIKADDVKGAMVCLNYCFENGFLETLEMSERVKKNMVLNPTQELDLQKIQDSCKPVEKVNKKSADEQ